MAATACFMDGPPCSTGRRLRKNRYDIEHFFFSLPTGLLTQLSRTSRSLPYLVSLRGSDVPQYDPFNVRLESMHRVLLPLTRRIWSRAGAVVALSNGLREIALRTAPDLKIDVVPNGIEAELFSPAQSTASANPNGRLKIISVSRLLERKGLHHLIEAIAKPNPLPVTLEIVGTGSYESELRKHCTDLGLDDHVRFLGFIRREKLPDLYRSADLFALPSQTESFGLVFAEAMACGLPVVATTVGGIPELVRHEIDGLLTAPASPDEVRSALQRLIHSPGERLSMGRSARLRIEEKYTWSSITRQYLSHYDEILSGSPGCPPKRRED